MTDAECLAQGGHFQGANTNCNDPAQCACEFCDGPQTMCLDLSYTTIPLTNCSGFPDPSTRTIHGTGIVQRGGPQACVWHGFGWQQEVTDGPYYPTEISVYCAYFNPNGICGCAGEHWEFFLAGVPGQSPIAAHGGCKAWSPSSPEGSYSLLGANGPCQCPGHYSEWHVTFSACSGVTGACCLPNGQCVETTSDLCAFQGGIYQGDGTTCTPNPCPNPIAARIVPPCTCSYPPGGNAPPSIWISEADYQSLIGSGMHAFRIVDTCYDLDAATVDPNPGPLSFPGESAATCAACCSLGCGSAGPVCAECPTPHVAAMGILFTVDLPGACSTVVGVDTKTTALTCGAGPAGVVWTHGPADPDPIGCPPGGCTVTVLSGCDLASGVPAWYVAVDISGTCEGQDWFMHLLYTRPISDFPGGSYDLFAVEQQNTGLINPGAVDVTC